MTSKCKIDANRENARKSTGPRTSRGKARASRNAMRHGLGNVKFGDGGFPENVERIARMICKDDTDPFQYERAIIIAESQVLVARVRAARLVAIERKRKRPIGRSAIDPGDDVDSLCAALPELLGLERYEQRGPCLVDDEPFAVSMRSAIEQGSRAVTKRLPLDDSHNRWKPRVSSFALLRAIYDCSESMEQSKTHFGETNPNSLLNPRKSE